MVTASKKKKKSLKTCAKLYRKKKGSGSFSLFLNIWHNGERLPKEFLGILLTRKLSSEENRDKLRVAEKVRNKREGELLHQRNAIPMVETDQDANLYEYIKLKSKHMKKPERHECLISKLYNYTGKGILPLSSISKSSAWVFMTTCAPIWGSEHLTKPYLSSLITPIRTS